MKIFEKLASKLWVGVAAVSALITPAMSYADNCCWDYDCNSACDWEWYIGGDYLYWKPCRDDLDYALVASDDPDSLLDESEKTIRKVCPDWESGWRAYLGMSSGDGFGIMGMFTQLNASAEDETSEGIFLYPTRMYPAQIGTLAILAEILGGEVFFTPSAASWDSEYNEWFAGLEYNWKFNQCQTLQAYFGAAGLHYNEDFFAIFTVNTTDGETEEIDPTGSSLFNTNSQCFNGAGIRLGTRYHSVLCDCFGAYLSANGSLLVGESNRKYLFGQVDEGEEFDEPLTFVEDGCCTLVPGIQFGLGLTYEACVCDVSLFFKVGYEFVAWYNLPDYRTFTGGILPVGAPTDFENTFLLAGQSSASTSRSIGYHGLTAGLGISF